MNSRLCGALAGCVLILGVSPDAASRQQAASADIDVCVLLPRDEAMKIVGFQGAGRARSSKRSDAGMECNYNFGTRGTITIMVNRGTSKAKWDAFMKDLSAAGATLEAVPGVGDGAYFYDHDRLYAHSGNYEITISTTPSPGDDPAKMRTEKVALAKAVVAKLKS
ncbi:MAG TPA: hypothetical protein VFO19_04005 [Vicinamibacterales bacterium]|nr:hypothetical protein [Vicinamibacterales bacterium]